MDLSKLLQVEAQLQKLKEAEDLLVAQVENTLKELDDELDWI